MVHDADIIAEGTVRGTVLPKEEPSPGAVDSTFVNILPVVASWHTASWHTAIWHTLYIHTVDCKPQRFAGQCSVARLCPDATGAVEPPEPIKVDWPYPELATVREIPLYLDFQRLGFHVRPAWTTPA